VRDAVDVFTCDEDELAGRAVSAALKVGLVLVAVVERFSGTFGRPLNDEVDLCWR